MRYRLVFRNGPRKGRAVDIPREKPVSLGRLPDCDIRLTDVRLSKLHCKLDLFEGELRVTDLGSSNGTFVNGVRSSERILREGDTLLVGETSFLVEAASEADAATAFDNARDQPDTSAIAKQETSHGDPLVGQTLGHYRLLQRIALGNSSVVYRAEHAVMGRPCAVKVLLPDREKDAGAVEAFLAMGRAGVELDHPNQVRVNDAGEMQGMHYLVMDLVSGVTVTTLVGVSKRHDPDTAMSIVMQVAVALVDAEGKGWSHGDLGPHRVLVDAAGKVRVTGFASEWSEAAARKDLLALGSLAALLLTGKGNADGVSVRDALPSEHKAVSAPVEKLLAIDEGQTYPSAMDFLLDVVPAILRRRGRSGLPETVRDLPSLATLVRRGSGTLHEMRLAADLTARLVPEKLPQVAGYVLAKASKPASSLVSDYYDAVELADGTMGILLAGGPRTGVSGAMTMLMVRSAFQSVAPFGLPPSKLLEELHEILKTDLKEGMTIPAVYLVLDPQAHTLTSAQAGAPGPLVWKGRGITATPTMQATLTRTEGKPLSATEFEAGDERTITLAPGEKVILATPWVTGTTNLRGEILGLGGLVNHLRKAEGDLAGMLDSLIRAVAAHRGPATAEHDLTLLAIERT